MRTLLLLIITTSLTFCVSQKDKRNVTKQRKVEEDSVTQAEENIELLKLKMFIGSQKI